MGCCGYSQWMYMWSYYVVQVFNASVITIYMLESGITSGQLRECQVGLIKNIKLQRLVIVTELKCFPKFTQCGSVSQIFILFFSFALRNMSGCTTTSWTTSNIKRQKKQQESKFCGETKWYIEYLKPPSSQIHSNKRPLPWAYKTGCMRVFFCWSAFS